MRVLPAAEEVWRATTPTWVLSGQLSPERLASKGEERGVLNWAEGALGHGGGVFDQARRHFEVEVAEVAVGEGAAGRAGGFAGRG